MTTITEHKNNTEILKHNFLNLAKDMMIHASLDGEEVYDDYEIWDGEVYIDNNGDIWSMIDGTFWKLDSTTMNRLLLTDMTWEQIHHHYGPIFMSEYSYETSEN